MFRLIYHRQTFTHLIRVTVEVKILQKAGGELAEQCVVGLVDCSQAPVGVVVGAGACTESTHWTVIEICCSQFYRSSQQIS